MSKKDLVLQIQKLAQKSTFPASPFATSSKPNAGTYSGGTPAGNAITGGVAEVKKMQDAMVELAAAVMRDAESATMGMKPKDQVSSPAGDKQKNSKKAFNDFIAEQYVGTLDPSKKGVEWSTDKSVVTYPAKKQTQTDIYELDAVMDVLRRVGKEKSELITDGNWDFRTDNALRNMMGFAHALLQLAGDFGLDNNTYTAKDLKAFQTLLSGYEYDGKKITLSTDEKKKRAPQIATHLKAITKLYHDFRQQVLARPEFRPYIEGDREFEAYSDKGTNKDVLTPQEQAVTKDPNAKITGLKIKSVKGAVTEVPLTALLNKESFDEFVASLGYTNTEKDYSPLILNVIKKQLEAM